MSNTTTPNKSRRSRGGGAAAAATTPSRNGGAGPSASSSFDLEVWTAPEEVPAPLLAKAREAYVAYDAGRDERLSTMATAAREEAAIAAGEDDDGNGSNGGGRGASRGGGGRARGGGAAATARDSQQAKDTGGDKASASAAEAYRQRWVALGDAAVARLFRYGSGARHALPPAAQAQLLAIVADRALHGDGGVLAGRAAALLSACLAAHPPATFVGASAAAAAAAAGDQEMGEAAAAADADADAPAAHRGHAHVLVNPVVWTPLPQGGGGGAGGGGAGDDDDGDGVGGGGRATRGAQHAREAAGAGRASAIAGAGVGFPLLFRRVEDALAATMAAKGGAAAAQALGLTGAELPASFSASASGGGGGPDGGAAALLLGHTVDVLQCDLAARLRAWSAANAEEEEGAAAGGRAGGSGGGGGDQEMMAVDEQEAGGRGGRGASRGGRRGGAGAAATAAGGAASSSAFTPRRAAAARLLTNSLLWRLLRDDLSWTADRAKGHLVRNLLLTLVLGSGELDCSLGGGSGGGGGGGGSGNGGNGANGNGNNNSTNDTDPALLASHAARLLRLIFELLSAAEASGLYSNAWAELPLSLRAGSGAAASAAAAAAAAAANAGGADSAAAVAASAAAAAARAAADDAAAFAPTNHGNDRAALDRVLLDACVSGVQQLLPFRSLPSARGAALRALPPLDRARLAAAAVAEAHQRSSNPVDSLSAAERERARAQAGRLALLDALYAYLTDKGRGAADYAGLVGGAASLAGVADAALWRVASDGVWAARGLGGADGVAVLLAALLAGGEITAAGGEGGGAALGGGGGGGGQGDLGARVKAALGTAAAPTSVEVAADLAAAVQRAQAMMAV